MISWNLLCTIISKCDINTIVKHFITVIRLERLNHWFATQQRIHRLATFLIVSTASVNYFGFIVFIQ
jgi:hypothetical protein